jgi:pantothenate kinase
VEGNYLLLGEAPWSGLRPLFDFSIFIDVPRAELELRLVKRWLDLGHSEASARAWVENNDMKNVDLVLASRQRPDFTWHFD